MERIKKRFLQIPIPAAFVICGMAALLAALSLTGATMWFAQKNKEEIAGSYLEELVPESQLLLDFRLVEQEAIPSGEAESQETPSQESFVLDGQPGTDSAQVSRPGENSDAEASAAAGPEQESGAFAIPRYVQLVLPEEDREKYNFYEGLNNAAAIFWYSVCLCLASLVFYLWKLKKPLHILNQAARKISENDLDFRIEYDGGDELGRLCQAFEAMRQELARNNRKLWKSVEERKRLNAAFAHDLRTPLTVLQGHADILLDTLADEEEAHSEILSSAQAISNQITRMNSYMDAMSALRRLEDYDPSLKAVSSEALQELLEETAASLFPGEKTASAGGPTASVWFEIQEPKLWMDQEAFSQIYENLLSNAARYARENILIRLCTEQDFLVLEVADDGPGFTPKDLRNAFAPYYRGERGKPASASHFGLGLYICSLLAGKLGGSVQLGGGENGGAKVTVKMISACFKIL